MAAYAALVSLMNTIDNIQNHLCLSTSLDTNQIESLGEKLHFLLDFVETYKYNSHRGVSKEAIEGLEHQIASAANAAEDVIESHIVDQIHALSHEKIPKFLPDLQKLTEQMDSIKENVVKIEDGSGFKDLQRIYTMPRASSRPLTSAKTTMVGFDGYLLQLLEGLTVQQSNLEIIPITGMGGIGKTTLANNVYENSLIVQYFDVRARVMVSQEYNVREIILELLSCLRESTNATETHTEDELGLQLYKALSGRRYLIVLDDLWSIEAWNNVKSFFPNNYNRSRVIVTTRLSDVADLLGSSGIVVNFLSDDESWSLFCDKAFEQSGCPLELEKIGKKIVKKCKGLPLSIVVIGGLLGKSPKTQEHWENVANDIGSILNSGEGNQCLNLLSLSYTHLPAFLKPCFLYFGIFPEDHEFRVSQLTKLWVAEGFIKPNKDQSLEEIAEGYINDLIDRNLVLGCRLKSDGKVKTCNIHDLLRDLCLRIVEKEGSFLIMRGLDTPQDIDRKRCIMIYDSIEERFPTRVLHTSKSARSLICLGNPVSSNSRLLRVLFVINSDSACIDFQHVNLRFLACKYVPLHLLYSSISLFWNLQTLIIRSHTTDTPRESVNELVAPSEIWEMRHLRHLELDWISLPDPPLSDEQDFIVLQNLQTLLTVLNFKCCEDVCKRMPNIKKLHVRYDEDKAVDEIHTCCRYNVGRLEKLESLYYSFSESPKRVDLLQNLMFPSSLMKLSLENCGLHWNDLTLIGSLPNLEVLKLKYQSVRGPSWNPIEEEFRRLKFLGIYSCSDLVNWNADKVHFPVLKHLVLFGLVLLNKIPLTIGEILTLECISVDECSVSAAMSAVKILEEQECVGNEGLQVRVEFWNIEKVEEFWDMVEEEGLTSLNFQLL